MPSTSPLRHSRRKVRTGTALGLAALALVMLPLFASSAAAEDTPGLQEVLERMDKQQAQLEAQRREIEELRKTVRTLSTALEEKSPAPVSADNAPAPAATPAHGAPAIVATPATDAPAAAPTVAQAPVPKAEAAVAASAPTQPSWTDDAKSIGEELMDRLEVNSYATMVYANYDWETDPDRRDSVDLERVTLEAELRTTETTKIEVEAEFEHLGTGSTMEFDRFEEFGEFESEIERGGEVELETVVVEWEPYKLFGLRGGYFPIGVGLDNFRHRPLQYFGTTRFEAEIAMLPDVWSEAGIGAFGEYGMDDWGALHWRLDFVTGLDSTGFSSGNWVKFGQQTRFEQMNADNLATAVRLDWTTSASSLLGASFYYGATSGNRPKDDLKVSAPVTIWDVHGEYIRGPLEVRAEYVHGHLNDSAKVSQANARLSNNLNVKRTPVGEDAYGAFIEAGLHIDDFLDFWPDGLIPFYRWDHYNTMDKVQAPVIRNPFMDRETNTVGINYRPFKWLVFKGQYSMRKRGIPEDNNEDTVSVGMGYDVDF